MPGRRLAVAAAMAAAMVGGAVDAFPFGSAVRERAESFPGADRDAAGRLVGLCLDSVTEAAPVATDGLSPARGTTAKAIRAARGGAVWAPLFGDVLLHAGDDGSCRVYVPGADARTFAWWLERWSNGPDGRAWQGKWFGRIEGTAWRRFRKRGGGDVHIIAVTGGERSGGMVEVSRRSWRDAGAR